MQRMVYPVLAFDRRTVAAKGERASRVALDKSPSNRSIDDNGHMHVGLSHISKANVCPYWGSEISGGAELGLDPNKTYNLYRDAAELEAAAATSNGKPVLLEHIPDTADDPQREIRCGSTGTDASWNAPYLDNTLVIWDGDAQQLIENEEQSELSCCYHYDVIMEPGEIDGVAYDGRMVNLRFNHVALVPEGRAGPDVRVADSRLEVRTHMLKSRKAILVSGALAAYIAPKLAADAKVNFDSTLKDVTAKTFAKDKAKIAAGVTAAVKGKLAADADVQDVVGLLDALENVTDGEVDDDLIDQAQEQTDPGTDPEAADAGGISEEAMSFLESKLSEEDLATFKSKMEGDTPAGEDAGGLDPVKATAPKPAGMDSRQVAKLFGDLREAESICRPLIGELPRPLETPRAYYEFALDAKKVDHKGVRDPVALRAMVKLALAPSLAADSKRPAHDASAEKSFMDEFAPGAERIIRS